MWVIVRKIAYLLLGNIIKTKHVEVFFFFFSQSLNQVPSHTLLQTLTWLYIILLFPDY